MKRVLLLILAAVMCLGCVACKGDTAPTKSTTEGTVGVADDSPFPVPEVTINAPVGTGVNIVGGLCDADCVSITVTDDAGNKTEIIPDRSGGYFFGQVKYSEDGDIYITANYEGGSSEAVSRMVRYNKQSDLMTSDEYMPVFCNDSRMHFYSALLAYSKSDVVSDSMMTRAEKNITENVAAVKAANPDAEIIYLVAPSSAAVYSEGLPEEYTEAQGQSMYEAFEMIATSCGAKVIYPLDTFIKNKDDGNGYKVYHNTDSHWTTYGAYLALSEMMSYISQSYPAAKPRTVEEMGFYTKYMCGGDALFSFGDDRGFENFSQTGSSGETAKTGISELTTMYTMEMPTSTIESVYRGGVSTYVNGNDNSSKATVTNPDGEGLPTALIIRDSFSCPAYDMVNDRFSTVWWEASHNYGLPEDEVAEKKPDYVIYIVSERNLLKVMLENYNVQIG